MTVMRACGLCGHVLDHNTEVHRSSLCPSCGRELKICLNCRFYKQGAHWDCLETIPEPVAEKDRANFCDYFRFRESADKGKPTAGKAERARDGFRQLFENGA